MGLLMANNAESTLATGTLTAGATTLDVATGHGVRFPEVVSPDFFYCTLVNVAGQREVIKVTAHTADSDTFQTIERAADPIMNAGSAVAYAFAAGDVVQIRIPAIAITSPTGTNNDSFQIDYDNTGVTLKHDTQELLIRNVSDSAYANLKAAGLTLSAALVLAGSITGATTGAFSSNVTVGGTLGVTGAITGGATSSIPIDNEATADKIKARDHGTAATPEVVNVVYGTGSAPAASGTPEGTLWFKYIA